MSIRLRPTIRIVRRRYLSIIYWSVRALAILMIPFGLGISLVHAQNTEPPDQAPVTTVPDGVNQDNAETTTQEQKLPNLTIGVSNTTADLPTGFALGLGGASTATLLALAGSTNTRGGQNTTTSHPTPATSHPAPTTTRGHINQTSTVREQTSPPLVAQTTSVSSLEENENEEAEEEGGFSWPEWALPVVGFITSQSQSFWQTLVRTGQHTIIPGFRLVVENGTVYLKVAFVKGTLAKVAIAVVIPVVSGATIVMAIIAFWTDPIVDGPEEQAMMERERLREEEAQRERERLERERLERERLERERQQQQTPSTPSAPPPQLPAEYEQWQSQAQQFEQNVMNGVYSNSSEDYQAAVAYLQSLQTFNQELIGAGLPPVTTQEFIDQVRARLDAGRYMSQINYYIGQAEAGEAVDLEMFRQLTNDALYLSNQMEARWSVPGFYPENIRNLQLDWMRDLQQQRQYVSEINDYIARAEAGESIDYPAFEQLTNDALYLSNQMEARWSVPGFYSSQERDHHLALVREFQIPDAPPIIPTEVPESDTEPANDPPEGEPPEEEPPDNPVPLPYIPDQIEPLISTPIPDIRSEHVPLFFPDQPGEDPIFIFTPIPGLEELLNGDNEPLIINPQPEEPVFIPRLFPGEPLPQLEPSPDSPPSDTQPIQAGPGEVPDSPPGEQRPPPGDNNPGVEGPDGSAPNIGDEPEVEQPNERIDPDYGFIPLRVLRQAAEASAEATKRVWENEYSRILAYLLSIGAVITNPQPLDLPSPPSSVETPPSSVETPPPEPRQPYPAQPHQTMPGQGEKPKKEKPGSGKLITVSGPDPDPPDPDPDAPITPEVVPDDVKFPPMRPADPDATQPARPPAGELPPAPPPAGELPPAQETPLDPDAPITPEIIADHIKLPPMRPADPDATFQMRGTQTNPSSRLPTTPQTITYTVQPGDTLETIAQRFYGAENTMVPAIAQLNALEDSEILQTGQEVQVPVY